MCISIYTGNAKATEQHRKHTQQTQSSILSEDIFKTAQKKILVQGYLLLPLSGFELTTRGTQNHSSI